MLNKILDASIVFSFDRTGFRRHARNFNEGALATNLNGKQVAITGANSGIGFETARALAKRGASVHLLCRNETRGQEAFDRIRSEFPEAALRLWIVDVSSFESIDAFIAQFDSDVLDILINNAGVLPAERHMTADGFELTLATNILEVINYSGLLPKLQNAIDPRVIAVSSGGMIPKGLVEDLDWECSFDGLSPTR